MHQHLEQWWLLGKSKNQCTGESPLPLHASDCNGLQGLHHSFCSLTGLFAEVGDLLSLPLGCALSGLHRLAEPPRMPPGAASCGFATLLPLHRVRNTNTLVQEGQTPTFAFGEPQVQLPANMCLFGTSCDNDKARHWAMEFWSATPAVAVRQKSRAPTHSLLPCNVLLFAPRTVLDFWFRSNVNLENNCLLFPLKWNSLFLHKNE